MTVAAPHTTSTILRPTLRSHFRPPATGPAAASATPIRKARSPRGRTSPTGTDRVMHAPARPLRCPTSAIVRRTAVRDGDGAWRVAVDAQRVDPERQDRPVVGHYRAAGQAERLRRRLPGIGQHGAGRGPVDQPPVGPVGPVAEPLLAAPSGRRAGPWPWRGSPKAAPGGGLDPRCHARRRARSRRRRRLWPPLRRARRGASPTRSRVPADRQTRSSARSCSTATRQLAAVDLHRLGGRSRRGRGRTDGRRPGPRAPPRRRRWPSWTRRHPRGRHRRR